MIRSDFIEPSREMMGIFSRGNISCQSRRWAMAKPSPSHAGDPRLLALGSAIRQARHEIGWSQERLASEAEVDRSYMGGIERGEHNLSIVNICRIAEVLGLSLAELFAKAGI
jgi:ribosome-binding protein aMBF1 (putative translation factor)